MNKIYRSFCDIYNRCFPQFYLTYDNFEEFLIHEDTKIFDCEADGQLVGFAIVEAFAIRLICVEPKKQRLGYGTKLLTEVEKYLIAEKNERIITGGVSSKLFIGAVSESLGFFLKNGFETVGQCDEMLMKLEEFKYNEGDFRGHKIAKYGWYQGDIDKLHAAVASVDETWVRFFDEKSHVYAAMVGDEIASFCLVDLDTKNYLTNVHGRVGMPGCVGTVPKFRNQGIAIEMIARATEYLKQQQMDLSFIFFTGVADWYKKLGYEIFLTEYFCEKKL